MGNHVQLLAVPEDARALARTIGLAHVRHARRFNAARGWTGHPLPWGEWLGRGVAEDEIEALRQATRTGCPCGRAVFVKDLELALARPLAPQKRGPKPRRAAESMKNTVSY